MAKVSAIQRNMKKKKLVSSFSNKREELKSIIKNKESSFEDRFEAVLDLASLPKYSSKSTLRNRCFVNGRPRGYYRKFGISRVAFREMALRGEIPGVKKSSW